MNINPILKQVLINGLITHSAARGVKRGSAWLGFFVLAGGIGFLALVYFSVATYVWLNTMYVTSVSASIVGGALVVIAAGVAVFGHMLRKGVFQKAAPKPEGLIGNIENALQSVMGGLEEPIRDNPKLAMLIAALAGFAAGDKLGDMGEHEGDGHYH